jgi:hypothetical protein
MRPICTVGGSDRYVEEYLYDLQADPYELTNLTPYPSGGADAGSHGQRTH